MDGALSGLVLALEENPKELYLETTSVLLKLVNNVLQNPTNPKYRSIRLGNPTITSKVLPAVGAMECLFEMGFEEGDDCLVLPNTISLEKLKRFRDEIKLRRNSYVEPCVEQKSNPSTLKPVPSTSKSNEQKQTLYQIVDKINEEPFLGRLQYHFHFSLQYENKQLQAKALAHIPVEKLETLALQKMRELQKAIKKGAVSASEVDVKDLMLVELLAWFKNSFFKWVDTPECNGCGGKTTFSGFSSDPKELLETNRVEVYNCSKCRSQTLFPRYNNPGKLLETRCGRCGEWANCFTLMCRALGWDVRHVLDETDHVWVEVYSGTQKRWVHCDPCENVCDSPLMYEAGWKKKLSYVMAYSSEEIQDVTWRYTSQHSEVLGRRKLCSEDALLSTIMRLRNQRQETLTPARKAFLARRTLDELVEFLTIRTPTSDELKGRSSGSFVWRQVRGELGTTAETATYVWEPTTAETEAKKLCICYSTSRDKYIRKVGGETKPQWSMGAFKVECVFRKKEDDWKSVYLARTEGSTAGRIVWRFDVSKCGLLVNHVQLTCKSRVFGTGKVTWLLCGGDICLRIPAGVEEYSTANLSGAKVVTLTAELSGGEGEVAWQHAQLFRQDMDNETDYPLDITITLQHNL